MLNFGNSLVELRMRHIWLRFSRSGRARATEFRPGVETPAGRHRRNVWRGRAFVAARS